MRRRWWPAALGLILLAGPVRADDQLVARLAAAAPAANPQVLSLAARAANCARRQGLLEGFQHLAVIDYSLPSTQPRLWVFDVARGRLLFQELVAHGRNTGEKVAEASRDQEEILYSEFDPAAIREHRHYWGLIRDRRPECYSEIVKP